MPYATVADLPASAKNLPPQGQKIFRAAFNAAHKQYNGDEKKAFAVAWAAAEKAGYHPPTQKAADMGMCAVCKTVAPLSAFALDGATDTTEGDAEPSTADRAGVLESASDMADIPGLMDGTTAEKSVWTTAYMNDLPDSAFLYISPGGSKDSDGKTTPRSLRHFPVRGSDGKVDIVHVRNALSRIPQSNVPAEAKAKAEAAAKRLLGSAQKCAVEREAIFKAVDKAKQLVYGVVLEPDTEDTQGDVLTKAEIEKAAHNYLRDYRIVGDSHVQKADAEVVESFIAPCDMLIGEALVSKGSWVMGVKVNDPALWQAVLDGEYTGFSIGGVGERIPLNGN